jgi:hypothetical protein
MLAQNMAGSFVKPMSWEKRPARDKGGILYHFVSVFRRNPKLKYKFPSQAGA